MDSLVVGSIAGVALSVSSGLNVTLTMFIAALLARSSSAVDAPAEWMTSPLGLAGLGAAVVAEFVGDKVPGVDHIAHVVLMPVAVLIGGALAISQIDGTEQAQAMLAVTGALVALAIHGARTGMRGVSSAATGGAANPVLSSGEDVGAVTITITALLLPLLAIIAVMSAASLIAVRMIRRRRSNARRNVRTSPERASV